MKTKRRNLKPLEVILKALANERRLKILQYLMNVDEATVGDIADHIKLSFKSTSRHLSVLSSAGILESEQKSLYVFYRISERVPKPAKKILREL